MAGLSTAANRFLNMAVAGDRSQPRGRYLKATQVFAPGDLINEFTSPLLALPDVAHQQVTCNYCLGQGPVPLPNVRDTLKLRSCTACHAVKYCSTACQKADWSAVHAKECKAFKELRDSQGRDWLPTPVRALMQVLLRARDPVIQAAFFKDGQADGLEGNVQKFRVVNGGKVWEDMELQSLAACATAGLGQRRDLVEKAREILCKIHTNAFDRSDLDSEQAGIYLEPTLAMINHSCLPNAFVSFAKRKAFLRAEKLINAGDEIEISYIDNTMPRSARRAHLQLYHLDCQCRRCADDMDVYQVWRESHLLSLNQLSLVPQLDHAQAPGVDFKAYSTLPKNEMETMYDNCQNLTSRGLERLRDRWRICRPLVDAQMWAVDPLAQTIVETAIMFHTDRQDYASALSLACFAASHADPYKFAAPFKPWRVKGAFMVARLLAVTAPAAASGELARKSAYPAIASLLAQCDQVSICQAMLHLVMRWGPLGHSDDWQVVMMAKAMFADIGSLPGREEQATLLEKWVTSPRDGEGRVFFDSQVLQPMRDLAAFAPDLLKQELQST